MPKYDFPGLRVGQEQWGTDNRLVEPQLVDDCWWQSLQVKCGHNARAGNENQGR